MLRCAQHDSQTAVKAAQVRSQEKSSLQMPAEDKRTLVLDGAKGLEHMMDQQKYARPVQRRAQGLQFDESSSF